MYNLKKLRENKNLSQAEVAKIINTTQQHYSKIEAGAADISGTKLKCLAKYYNVSVDYILGLIEEPKELK